MLEHLFVTQRLKHHIIINWISCCVRTTPAVTRSVLHDVKESHYLLAQLSPSTQINNFSSKGDAPKGTLIPVLDLVAVRPSIWLMLIPLIKDIPFQDNSPACDLLCSCKIMTDKKTNKKRPKKRKEKKGQFSFISHGSGRFFFFYFFCCWFFFGGGGDRLDQAAFPFH